MADIQPASWVGDTVQEFKNLPTWAKIGVGGVVIVVAGFAYYQWRQSSQTTASANKAVGGSLAPGGGSSGSSSSGIPSSSSSFFPNVSSDQNNVPLLPSGVNPIYSPGGNLVGFQNGSSAPTSAGTATPTKPPVPTPTPTTPTKTPTPTTPTKTPTPTTPTKTPTNNKPPTPPTKTVNSGNTTPKPPVTTPKPPVKPPAAAAQKSYTVQSGDSLSAIAGRYGLNWQQLYDANKGVVGNNPNLIYPGQHLTIPSSGNSSSSTSAPKQPPGTVSVPNSGGYRVSKVS